MQKKMSKTNLKLCDIPKLLQQKNKKKFDYSALLNEGNVSKLPYTILPHFLAMVHIMVHLWATIKSEKMKI